MTTLDFQIETSLFPLLGRVSFLLLFLNVLLTWIPLAFSDFAMTTHRSLKDFEVSPAGETADSYADRTSPNSMNLKESPKLLPQIGESVSFLSSFLLGLTLVLRWYLSGHFPLSNLYELLLFLTFSMSVLQISLGKVFSKEGVGGDSKQHLKFNSFLSPLTLGIMSFATFTLPVEMQKSMALIPALQSNWLIMHVSVMVIAYTLLLAGATLAMVFLISSKILSFDSPQESNTLLLTTANPSPGNAPINMKLKDPPSSIRGEDAAKFDPPESSLLKRSKEAPHLPFDINFFDQLSYRLLGLGFPFLTLGILSGAIWANEAWGSYWSWDPKETWALITWLVFAIYFHCRLNFQWGAQKSSLISALGFFVLWFCFLGINLMGKGLHTYGQLIA